MDTPDDTSPTAAAITSESADNGNDMSLVLRSDGAPAGSSELSSAVVTQDQSAADGDSDAADFLKSIHEISPIPKCQKQRTKKWKPQAAAVLTSSPFKKQLMERKTPPQHTTKEKTASAVSRCRPTKQAAPQSKKKTGKKVTCRGQKEKPRKLPLPREPKKRKNNGGQSRQFYCIYCSELFVEPPDEDWMQCVTCKEWYHKECGNDTDICDLCKNSQ